MLGLKLKIHYMKLEIDTPQCISSSYRNVPSSNQYPMENLTSFFSFKGCKLQLQYKLLLHSFHIFFGGTLILKRVSG